MGLADDLLAIGNLPVCPVHGGVEAVYYIINLRVRGIITTTVLKIPPTISLHPSFEDVVVEAMINAVRSRSEGRGFCLR